MTTEKVFCDSSDRQVGEHLFAIAESADISSAAVFLSLLIIDDLCECQLDTSNKSTSITHRCGIGQQLPGGNIPCVSH